MFKIFIYFVLEAKTLLGALLAALKGFHTHYPLPLESQVH